MGDKPIYVHVCAWDPAHTLSRIQAQQTALRDGVIAKLVKKHGKGDALRSVMQKAKLTTMSKSLNGDLHCPECGALMDRLLGRDGIVDKVEVVRDIVDDLDAAIDRTRMARRD